MGKVMWGPEGILDRVKLFSNNSPMEIDELEIGDYPN